MTYCDIPYAPHHDQCQFDLYPPPQALSIDNPAPLPLICFVHGGAWKAEDKRMHADLARRLARTTGLPVAVPNYRLTPADNTDPAFYHPMHAADILLFLGFLQTWAAPVPLDPSRLILMGHSCSAHMIAAILLDSDAATPALAPPPAVSPAVRGVVLSEGIYDLSALVTRFPSYQEWFIAPAFGDLPSYAPFDVTRYPLRPSEGEAGGVRPAWLLVHSKGDTLVDVGQTEAMKAHLEELDPSSAHVEVNTDDFTEEHDDIIQTEKYVQIVHEFAARVLELPGSIEA